MEFTEGDRRARFREDNLQKKEWVRHEGEMEMQDTEGMETKKCHVRKKFEIINDTHLTGMSISRRTYS